MTPSPQKMLSRLTKHYPRVGTRLVFRTPIEILVATILSAQCTDARVNSVTGGLFKKYRTAADFARARPRVFEREIRSTGFYRQKAKNIITTAQKIANEFNGNVPRTMTELLTLPGVARKTANIVLHHGFGIVEGIAVDTHVRRLSKRLGFTREDDPVKIERDLMSLLPRKDWGRVNEVLIEHGRAVCHARRPGCSRCMIQKVCPSFGIIAQAT